MRDMNKVTALFCTRIVLRATLFICASLVLASCGPKQLFGPTSTPTPTNTPTPSSTPTPTNTPMPSNTPTPTLSPTPTLVPIQVSAASCSAANIQQGLGVWAKGYLGIPAGYYANTSSYTIWLQDTQLGDARITIKIPGGNESNSMYFDSGRPHIKDNLGRIIPWIRQGGQETYITNYSVTVRGTWLGECSLKIEIIE